MEASERDLIKQGPHSSCTSHGSGVEAHSCCSSPGESHLVRHNNLSRRKNIFGLIAMDFANRFVDSFYRNSDDQPEFQTILSFGNTPQVSDGDLSTPAYATIAPTRPWPAAAAYPNVSNLKHA